MFDIKRQKENLKNHVAKLTDYGNIKVLDFKNPDSFNYRIRFLFEEDYCRLHISGDLGELTATNYNNMTFGHFKDFVNNIDYFIEKIDCHSRAIYMYDEDKAREDLKNLISEYEMEEIIAEKHSFDSPEESIDYQFERKAPCFSNGDISDRLRKHNFLACYFFVCCIIYLLAV